MSKIAVIYNSQTGFTKRYAEWIADATGAECLELSDAKKLAVFCVGASPADNPEIEPTLRKNFTDDERQRVRVFYCPGGFCYEKMSLKSKLMMKMFRKVLESNKNRTPSDELMIKMISSSYDISDKKYIEPIVEYLAD